ncbi:hypothetical protein [Microbacter margulisiae]|uniref:Uncharacterized protein n=1 Tax=Microbacter margulisiae TaxID=1350067 RepID=A0A7W5DRU3_9PORP|nr:hypothetical protein [Microbacter margulisiae]MBB3187917.1 hypothetical protein [Microbacter margulisiae]
MITTPFSKILSSFCCGLTVIFSLFIFSVTVHAQALIDVSTSYVQDFDAIGTSNTATLPNGWAADNTEGVRAVGSYANAGNTTTRNGGDNMSGTAHNGIYNFGAGDPDKATERALGGLASTDNSKSVNLYLQLQNTGADPIGSFKISYDVEKYRNGSNSSGFSVSLYYSTDGEHWTVAGDKFMTVFPADADNSGFSPTPGSISSVSNEVLSLPSALASNQSIFLAWNYSVSSKSVTTNAQALGIDNVAIQALQAVATDLKTAKQSTISVVSTKGRIRVTGAIEPVEIYSVSGLKMTTINNVASTVDIPIASGFYVVKSGDDVCKVLVQ